MARQIDTAKQNRWLQLIARWQGSQLTVFEFCQRHRISEASFYSWRRVLRERGLLDDSMPSKMSAEAPTFVELSTVVARPTESAIEVVLNERRLLRVRPGFDAGVLLELVRLLEAPAC
jgi:transposase-like protein